METINVITFIAGVSSLAALLIAVHIQRKRIPETFYNEVASLVVWALAFVAGVLGVLVIVLLAVQLNVP